MKQDAGSDATWFVVILLALAPLAGTWLYLQRHWAEIPARFPTHWNASGVANRWSERSPGVLAMPLIIGGGIIVLMILTAALTRTAQANDRQREAGVMLPVLAAISWAMSILFCWIALTPLGHSSGPAGFTVVVVAQLVLMIGIIVWTSRRAMRGSDIASSGSAPDEVWRAGGFVYYNPSDAAVMVPKRLGWGWTLNFGRPMAWVYLSLILLLALAAVTIPLLLK